MSSLAGSARSVRKALQLTKVQNIDTKNDLFIWTVDTSIPVQQSIDLAIKLKKAIGDSKMYIELIKSAEYGTSEFYEQQKY